MDTNTKVMAGSIFATILILIGAVVFLSRTSSAPATELATTPVDASILIRDAGYNTKGPISAPVTLVEFSDPQCPACATFAPTLRAIMDKYPEQVRVVYRHFPLPMHPEARPGSLAMEAAGLQGKFWEMQEALFANQEKLKDAFYPELATGLGIDVAKFNQDRNSQSILDILQQDTEAAYNTLNLQATPTLFINGIKQDNSQLTFEALSQKIDAILTSLPPASESTSSSTTSQ